MDHNLFHKTLQHFLLSGDFNTNRRPHYPRSNELAESSVKIVKNVIRKAAQEGKHKALLPYRTTPLNHGKSPAELMMERRLKSTLGVHPRVLKTEPVITESIFISILLRRRTC